WQPDLRELTTQAIIDLEDRCSQRCCNPPAPRRRRLIAMLTLKSANDVKISWRHHARGASHRLKAQISRTWLHQSNHSPHREDRSKNDPISWELLHSLMDDQVDAN